MSDNGRLRKNRFGAEIVKTCRSLSMDLADRSCAVCSLRSAEKDFKKNQAFRSQSEPTARDLLSDLLACVAGDTLPERVVLAARTNLTICHCERSL